jgi:hypothetical protein
MTLFRLLVAEDPDEFWLILCDILQPPDTPMPLYVGGVLCPTLQKNDSWSVDLSHAKTLHSFTFESDIHYKYF